MKRFGYLLATLAALGIVLTMSVYMPSSAGRKGGTVIVAAGQSASDVAGDLKGMGFVRSAHLTEYLIERSGRATTLRTGSYVIPPGSNIFSIVRILTTTKPSNEKRFTLIEGWDIRDYASYLHDHGFAEASFTSAIEVGQWQTQYPFLGALSVGRTLEGYLFPDTYVLPLDGSVTSLVDYMLRTFDKKITSQMRSDITSSNRSLDEVVILASIVEKEVSSDADRKIVAGIFINRLKSKMGLQSDATINYLTASGRARSTKADLSIDSPYNTYKYRGLPPGPISNPGLSALSSVIYPAATEYYYFLTSADGTVHYATSFEQHQKNRSLYLN